jgi:hypothetical protein
VASTWEGEKNKLNCKRWKWGGEQKLEPGPGGGKRVKKTGVKTHSGLESRCLPVRYRQPNPPATLRTPGSLEGFLEGREAQKDSGWLRPGGHWPRGGGCPVINVTEGGVKAWKLRNLLHINWIDLML